MNGENNIVESKEEFPLVSILMAVYKPNEKWLIEQLKSLNNQTYENLELIVYDDCPKFPTDEGLFKKYITNFKYTIIRGKVNKGSNFAFEELTKVGNGKYFAYCDQDDIWEENKIKILVNIIKKEESVLAYSDMSVIDADNNLKYFSLLNAKPRIKYVYGDNLLDTLFFKNCISGCAMLVKSEIAKRAVPFSKLLVHDQWIAIVSSIYGRISFTNMKLVRYRMHGSNQTGSLKGIETKSDYYKSKVFNLENRLNELLDVIRKSGKHIDTYRIEEFCKARVNKKLIKIFKYRKLCKSEACFEIVIKYMNSYFVDKLLAHLK